MAKLRFFRKANVRPTESDMEYDQWYDDAGDS
jgi:hypothetical protein